MASTYTNVFGSMAQYYVCFAFDETEIAIEAKWFVAQNFVVVVEDFTIFHIPRISVARYIMGESEWEGDSHWMKRAKEKNMNSKKPATEVWCAAAVVVDIFSLFHFFFGFVLCTKANARAQWIGMNMVARKACVNFHSFIYFRFVTSRRIRHDAMVQCTSMVVYRHWAATVAAQQPRKLKLLNAWSHTNYSLRTCTNLL